MPAIAILHLEDLASDSELVNRLLRQAELDFSSSCVSTESEFRAALSGQPPDIILADYHLPGFDGISALLIAREIAPDIPFIFLSGSIGEERAVDALKQGATDYIIKDRQTRLPTAINRALADRKARDTAAAADRKIRELSHQNELILMHAAEAIIGTDRSGIVTFLNPAAARLAGWQSLETPRSHQILHADQHACPVEPTLADGKMRTGETEFVRLGGERISVEFSCSPIIEHGSITGCVLMCQDVTGRKLLQRQLEQTQRVSSLGRLAGTIAHEFNNVLMGISPFVDVIQRRTLSDEKIQDATQRISSSIERGRKITSEMLKNTRSKAPSLRPIDLSQWVSSQEPELEAVLGPTVRLVTRLDPSCWVTIDPGQLQQVLSNLAVNARDAMPHGGAFTVTVHGERPSHVGFARLCVEDTGSGIPPAILPNIFEPLFTTKRSGTGFGLAVVQQIVTRHGGTVTVTSTLGEGTAFEILLPGPLHLSSSRPTG